MMRPDYRLSQLELFLERTHTPGTMWLFDFQGFERQDILPGIAVSRAGAHTEGSINVFAETANGMACLCGDVIQDVKMQVIAPPFQANHREPRMSGNSGMSQGADRAAIKAMLGQVQWILPAHDDGYRVDHGQVVGRLSGAEAPGPVEIVQ